MILIEAHSVKVIVKFVGWLKIYQAYPNTSPRPVLSPCLGCRYPTHCPSYPPPLSAIWAIFSMQHGKSQIWKLSAVLKIYDFVNTHTPMYVWVCVCSKYATNFKLICRQKEKEKVKWVKLCSHFTCFISRRIIGTAGSFKFTQNFLRDFSNVRTTHISP